MIIYVILMAKASIKRKQSRKQLQNKQEWTMNWRKWTLHLIQQEWNSDWWSKPMRKERRLKRKITLCS
jgi:ubiquinone biosynthesis protein Coq4